MMVHNIWTLDNWRKLALCCNMTGLQVIRAGVQDTACLFTADPQAYRNLTSLITPLSSRQLAEWGRKRKKSTLVVTFREIIARRLLYVTSGISQGHLTVRENALHVLKHTSVMLRDISGHLSRKTLTGIWCPFVSNSTIRPNKLVFPFFSVCAVCWL